MKWVSVLEDDSKIKMLDGKSSFTPPIKIGGIDMIVCLVCKKIGKKPCSCGKMSENAKLIKAILEEPTESHLTQTENIQSCPALQNEIDALKKELEKTKKELDKANRTITAKQNHIDDQDKQIEKLESNGFKGHYDALVGVIHTLYEDDNTNSINAYRVFIQTLKKNNTNTFKQLKSEFEGNYLDE